MRISDGAADKAKAIDGRIVESLLETVRSFDKQDVFESEAHEELYESTYKDEEFVPVYDGIICKDREFFSYEYICQVLDYVDGPPKRNMAAVQHQFRRVRDKSYLKRFRQYRYCCIRQLRYDCSVRERVV